MGSLVERIDGTMHDFVMRASSDVSTAQLAEIEALYAGVYGETWVGHDAFTASILPTISHVAAIEEAGRIVACACLDRNRVGLSGVHTDYQGNGLWRTLFERIEQRVPDAWFSIRVDSPEALLKAIASERLSFMPVNDKQTVMHLFAGLGVTINDTDFSFQEIPHPILTPLFARKGIDQGKFLSFSRKSSLHGPSYKQIVFQCQRAKI